VQYRLDVLNEVELLIPGRSPKIIANNPFIFALRFTRVFDKGNATPGLSL